MGGGDAQPRATATTASRLGQVIESIRKACALSCRCFDGAFMLLVARASCPAMTWAGYIATP